MDGVCENHPAWPHRFAGWPSVLIKVLHSLYVFEKKKKVQREQLQYRRKGNFTSYKSEAHSLHITDDTRENYHFITVFPLSAAFCHP